MPSNVPDDPVLAEILSSDQLAHCLRSGCRTAGGELLVLVLLARYGGLTRSGAEYLATQVDLAVQAGEVLASLAPDQPIPLEAIPVIPGALASAQGGRIVTIWHQVVERAIEGPLGGVDGEVISVEPISQETLQDVVEAVKNEINATLPGGLPDDVLQAAAEKRLNQILGIYRVY